MAAGLLASIGLGLGVEPTGAASVTTTFAVTVNVLAAYTISAAPMSFGTYTGLVADATSNLSIVCSNTTPYTVGLDNGLHAGATPANRSMPAGSTPISYALFSNAGRTIVWGETIGTDTVGGTGTGSNQTLIIYGRVPAAQFVTPALYSDTVTATLTY